jgi:hypothetical protein
MKTLIIIILLVLIFFLYNSENFAEYNNTILPTISYKCPDNSILKDNLCYELIIPKCDNDNCYIDNNITNLKCNNSYTLQNNICISNFDNTQHKPYCNDGYTIVNDKCIQLNGLPICPDNYIPYNNICKSEGFIPKTIYTCPDGSTNEYGGICNGDIYDNSIVNKAVVSILY